MKLRSLSVLAVTGLLIGISSCNKVLEKQPYASFSDQSAYTTLARVQLALNGVYDAAQSGFYAGGAVRGYPFGAANIEQGEARGEHMYNSATFYQITYEATYNNVSPNVDYMFQTLYSLINKANLTIVGLHGAASANVISAAQALQYEAECRFLRAMAHHELVLNFSKPFADGAGGQIGVIYRDQPVSGDASITAADAIQRSTVKVSDDYTKILADLDYAETNLPAAPDLATYRASKAAAIALKMRVKMHMGDWAGVITEGAKIVSGTFPNYSSPINGYKLTATVDGPFTNNTSTESMFSIKNDATDNSSVNGALAQLLGSPALGGRGLLRVSPILWSDPQWVCDDARRTLLATFVATPASNAGAYTTKYHDYINSSDATPQIRYAEVLLTLAEANSRLGNTTTALNLLNAVRNRAVSASEQYTAASFPTSVALTGAILKERSIELFAEGKRWGDLHRLALDPNFAPIPGGGIPSKLGTGLATAAMFSCTGATFTRSVPAIPYTDNRFLWPVPLSELQPNPNYTQNPGY